TGCNGIAAGTPIGTPDLYYDPCAFAVPPLGRLGNAPRNFLSGPGLRNLDFSLTKMTKLSMLGEGGALEFRAEVFNLTNHANRFIPSGRTVFTATNSATTLPITANQPAVNPSAGKDNDDTVTGGRRIQFALKIVF